MPTTPPPTDGPTPGGDAPPRRRPRFALVGVIVGLVAVLVCGGLAVGWAGGWLSRLFVDSLPPQVSVHEATEDAERARDAILGPLEAQLDLVSIDEQGVTRDEPEVITEQRVCQSDLRTSGYSIDSSIFFSSAGHSLPEALLAADTVIVDAGFTIDAEDDAVAVAAELQQYLDSERDGPAPRSIGYAGDDGFRVTLRYSSFEEELLILVNGPCYRHTPDEHGLTDN